VAKGSRVTVDVSSGPGNAALPAVSGLTRRDAFAALRRRGFRPVAQSQSSDTVPFDQVISTDPAAGAQARVGSVVTVLVSSGPAPVGVPDVTGQSQAAAASALSAAGLRVGTITRQSAAGKTPGTVISQSPGPNTSVKRGAAVNLTLAKAPAKSQSVAVPNVVGQQQAQAAATLGGAGFKVQSASTPVTNSAQNGVVVSQSPAASQQARKGSTVTIRVGAFTPPPSTSTTTPPPSTSTSTPPPTPPAAAPAPTPPGTP
jgi:beta-lactam-binding protein with PASTA domain